MTINNEMNMRKVKAWESIIASRPTITFGKYPITVRHGTDEEIAKLILRGEYVGFDGMLDIAHSPKSWPRKLWDDAMAWDNVPLPGTSSYKNAACYRLSNVLRVVTRFKCTLRSTVGDPRAIKLSSYTPVVCDDLESFEKEMCRVCRTTLKAATTRRDKNVTVKIVFKTIVIFDDMTYETYMGPPGKFMDRLHIDYSSGKRAVIQRRGRNK